jgi:hypothetical protein
MKLLAFARGGAPRAAVVVALLALGVSRASADIFIYTPQTGNAAPVLSFGGSGLETVTGGSFQVDTALNTATGSFTVAGGLVNDTFSFTNLTCAACNSILGTDLAGDLFQIVFQVALNGDFGSGQLKTGSANGSFFMPNGGPQIDSTGANNAFNAVAAPGPIPGAGFLSYIALGLLSLGSMGWKRLRQQTA